MAGSIEHVVIIVRENHTFDNDFGRFPGADGASLPMLRIRPPMTPTTNTRRG